MLSASGAHCMLCRYLKTVAGKSDSLTNAPWLFRNFVRLGWKPFHVAFTETCKVLELRNLHPMPECSMDHGGRVWID